MLSFKWKEKESSFQKHFENFLLVPKFHRKEVRKMMDERRKGEIALALFKYRVGREGIRITPDARRELGNVAKATGIPLNELKEFIRLLIEEMLKETFGE